MNPRRKLEEPKESLQENKLINAIKDASEIPISLINISSKIFEELVLRRMTYFIDQKPANRFGAQPGYNAIDPVLQFVYNIKHASGTGTARCVRQYASQEVMVQLMQKLKFHEPMITWVYHFTKNITQHN
ncbi:unnamed protein product [Ambrosiozyma monospora]|uniref:Unnamed protein product n=1 Tax=Ambrosiozyma monospora TaxID=43982 RepID=A0A9W6Z457_AMBMO|nr:unnamed protein product [Ambrosiozyma monospora]